MVFNLGGGGGSCDEAASGEGGGLGGLPGGLYVLVRQRGLRRRRDARGGHGRALPGLGYRGSGKV